MDEKLLKFYINQRKKKKMTFEEIIMDYLNIHPKKRKRDIINDLVHKTSVMDDQEQKRVMSYSVLHNYLKKLVKSNKIMYNNETRVYQVNPSSMIKSYLEKCSLEVDLFDRLKNSTNIDLKFKTEQIDKQIFFSNQKYLVLNSIVQKLIRDIILLNPELWTVLNKPDDFDFSITIKCNAKDPIIFENISRLRDEYTKLGKILKFDFLNFTGDVNFGEDQVILNKPLDDYYKIAVGEHFLREKFEKKF